ncbi:hypothetical protein MMC17_009965 [Xylographa soralifera]|nr:hypothetical protein [Xylographa soralifera]
MALDPSLLRNVSQRQVQSTLLQYHVAPPIARGLAQLELRHWTPDQLESIFRKVPGLTRNLRHFASGSGLALHESVQERDAWVRPPRSLVEQAAKGKLALCVNVRGGWSLRTRDFVAISHVWEEGIQADNENRGLAKSLLDSIFVELGHVNTSWIWLDCFAIPGGNKALTAHEEIVKKDIINNLSSIYHNADAVIIFDAMTMRLQSHDLVDVAVVLLCGKWMTRVWTLQEIWLAKDGLVLTALGHVKFREILLALRYLSGNQENNESVIGPHSPSVLHTVHETVNAPKFEQMYLRLIRLVYIEGQKPTLTSLALTCYGRRTGNDIDYARAFFPLLGLEWKVQNSREQGMDQIYKSQMYNAKRLVLMHGSSRCSFRPGWAPSYLTGLIGPILSPDDPLGDIEYTKRGLARRWYTYKIGGHRPFRDQNVLILLIENTESNSIMMACRLDPREAQQSRDCFFNAISEGHAFALSNQKLAFPTANGLAINVLLVERDGEVEYTDEAWVCFTSEVDSMEGTALPEVHSWLLLHESPISTSHLSGKEYTRIARRLDYSSGSRKSEAPLLVAIRNRDLSEFRNILRSSSNLDIKDGRGCTPLHLAVLTGQAEMLDALLDRNFVVDAVDAVGRTALNLAAEEGSPETVERLLAHGANPNLHPSDEAGCLNQALLKKQHRIIKILIDHGAEVNKKDTWGWYPLFHASRDFESASMLLNAGADPNIGLVGGAQLIHFAARAGQTKTVELLLDRGIEVNQREGAGSQPTALYRAIQEQNEETVALLIRRGADPNLVFENSWTCVHLAAKSGNFRIIQLVLGHRTHHPNDACGPERWTALHLTAREGHRVATKLLLEAGWDYTVVDAAGRTPAALAGENGHRSTLETIRDFHIQALRALSDGQRRVEKHTAD